MRRIQAGRYAPPTLTPALAPDGDLLITIFGGWGDSYLALPVLREIGRRFGDRTVYLACFSWQIEPLFQDFPFTMVPAYYRKDGEVVVDCDIEGLSFSRIEMLNDCFPPCLADADLARRYPSTPRWAVLDGEGRPL